jgi:hypothetical protein
MQTVRRSVFLLFSVLPMIGAYGQDTSLVASVDRELIRSNESFTYTLHAEGDVSGRPDFSVLTRDFDLLQSGSSRSIQVINGRSSVVADWQIELMPRRPGEFELPPVEVGGLVSNPVRVEILPPSSDAEVEADVFIEVELDRSEAYVQAQAIFTLRLFVGINIAREALSTLPVSGGEAIVERLGGDREYQTVRGERLYRVLERKFAIFPQTTGVLTLGPVDYQASVRGLGFTRQRNVRSDVVEFAVLPAVQPPQSHPDAVWLPARDLRIEEVWRDGIVFEQGVPRTRQLTVIADGLLETQLPELDLTASGGLRQYADQPELSREVTVAGIEARRMEKFAVIAQQSGLVELPPVELPWWNVDEARWEIARVEPRTVEIAPADEIAQAPQAPASSEPLPVVAPDTGLWPWVAGALGLGWALTIAAWVYSRREIRVARPAARSASRATSSRALLKQLSAACRVDDAQRARELLLEWAGRQFSDDPPANLGMLAARLSGPIAVEIEALEAALYGRETAVWRGERLAELIKATQSVALGAGKEDPDPLVPLYR